MSGESPNKRLRVVGPEGLNESIDYNLVEGQSQQEYSSEDAALETELRQAQAEIDLESQEMLAKMKAIEQEYDRRKQPLYKSRGRVIRRIPGFWLHCFLKHEDISQVLGSLDQEILSSLSQLEVEPFEDANTGYKIIMHFEENQHFEDKILEKEVVFTTAENDTVPECKVSGCEPKWKSKDPTQQEILSNRKRQRDPIAFIRWFIQPNTFMPGLVDSLAEIIKEQLWVNPLEFMEDGEEEEQVEVLDDESELEGEEAILDDEEVWDLEAEDVEAEEEGQSEVGLEDEAGPYAEAEYGEYDLDEGEEEEDDEKEEEVGFDDEQAGM